MAKAVGDTKIDFGLTIEALRGPQTREECAYLVRYHRGSKVSGTTQQKKLNARQKCVMFNYTTHFLSTLQPKDKTRYKQKIITFTVEEIAMVGGKMEKKKVAEMQYDLADVVPFGLASTAANSVERRTTIVVTNQSFELAIAVIANPPSDYSIGLPADTDSTSTTPIHTPPRSPSSTTSPGQRPLPPNHFARVAATEHAVKDHAHVGIWEEKIASLESQLEVLTEEKQHAAERLAEELIKCSEVEEERVQLEKMNDGLRVLLKEKDDMIQLLEGGGSSGAGSEHDDSTCPLRNDVETLRREVVAKEKTIEELKAAQHSAATAATTTSSSTAKYSEFALQNAKLKRDNEDKARIIKQKDDQLLEMEKEIEALRNGSEQSTLEKTVSSADIAALRHELEEKQLVIQQQTSVISNNMKEIEALQHDLDIWKHKSESPTKRSNDLAKQITALQHELDQRESMRNETSNSLQAKQTEIESLKRESTAALEALREELSEAMANVHRLEADVAEKSELLRKAQEDAHNSSSSSEGDEESQVLLTELRREIAELEHANEVLKQQNETEISKSAVLRERLESLQSRLDEMESEKMKQEGGDKSAAEQLMKTISQLRITVQGLEDDVTERDNRIAFMSDAAAESEKTHLQQINALEKTILDLRKDIASHEEVVASLTQELKSLAQRTQDVEDHKNDNSNKLEDEIRVLKNDVTSKNTLIAEAEQRVKLIEIESRREIDELKKEVASLKSQADVVAKSPAAPPTTDISKLIAEKDAQIKELVESDSEKEAYLAEREAMLEKLQDDMKAKDRMIADLENQAAQLMDDMTKSIQAKETTIRELEEKVKSLKAATTSLTVKSPLRTGSGFNTPVSQHPPTQQQPIPVDVFQVDLSTIALLQMVALPTTPVAFHGAYSVASLVTLKAMTQWKALHYTIPLHPLVTNLPSYLMVSALHVLKQCENPKSGAFWLGTTCTLASYLFKVIFNGEFTSAPAKPRQENLWFVPLYTGTIELDAPEEQPSKAASTMLLQGLLGAAEVIAQETCRVERSKVEQFIQDTVLVAAAQQRLGPHTNDALTRVMEDVHSKLTEMKVPEVFIYGILERCISQINHSLLGALVNKHNESLCCLHVGQNLKVMLASLTQWIITRWKQFPELRKILAPIRQACDVFMLPKESLLEASVRDSVCPNLTAKQLATLVASYHGDLLDQRSVPANIVTALQKRAEQEGTTTQSPPVPDETQLRCGPLAKLFGGSVSSVPSAKDWESAEVVQWCRTGGMGANSINLKAMPLLQILFA
eukprot:PhF_6_TR37505/c0_g1_i2/m.55393